MVKVRQYKSTRMIRETPDSYVWCAGKVPVASLTTMPTIWNIPRKSRFYVPNVVYDLLANIISNGTWKTVIKEIQLNPAQNVLLIDVHVARVRNHSSSSPTSTCITGNIPESVLSYVHTVEVGSKENIISNNTWHCATEVSAKVKPMLAPPVVSTKSSQDWSVTGPVIALESAVANMGNFFTSDLNWTTIIGNISGNVHFSALLADTSSNVNLICICIWKPVRAKARNVIGKRKALLALRVIMTKSVGKNIIWSPFYLLCWYWIDVLARSVNYDCKIIWNCIQTCQKKGNIFWSQ